MFKKIGILVTHPGALQALLSVEKALRGKHLTQWVSDSKEKVTQMLTQLGSTFIEYLPEIDLWLPALEEMNRA